MLIRQIVLAGAFQALLWSGGCRGAPTDATPIVPIRNMYDQPRYDPQSESPFFKDRRTMRLPVAGTVAREMAIDPVVATGWYDSGRTWTLMIPEGPRRAHGSMEALLERGRERFGIYCAPCHGLGGEGDGMIAQRGGGAIRPPTFHADRLRHLPDGQIFATISYGVRNMPSYRHSIPVLDRWAIVGYVRALQLSRAAAEQAMNLQGNSR